MNLMHQGWSVAISQAMSIAIAQTMAITIAQTMTVSKTTVWVTCLKIGNKSFNEIWNQHQVKKTVGVNFWYDFEA